MSELNMVSPLLDNLVVDKEISRQADQTCYAMHNKETKTNRWRFIFSQTTGSTSNA